MPRFTSAQVREYYDRHTPAFIAFGQGRNAGAIHRAVWGPGVDDRDRAFHYVDDRIAEAIGGLHAGAAPLHVVDLGCGVGASLCYLAGRLPIRGTGITLSPVQAKLARERIRQGGLADRVVCLEGDYCDLPGGIAPADAAYAIESFVHGPSPGRFFEQCRRLVRPGGLLMICDDFRRPSGGAGADRAIGQFCEGWHVNTLLRPAELRSLAREAGFEHESTVDLSPYLEIHRWRDRAVGILLAAGGWLPLDRTPWRHLRGGHALQTCLHRGWVGYDLTCFRRAF